MGLLKYISNKLYSNGKEVLTEDSIESGTYTYGQWTKFPDGTLIETFMSTYEYPCTNDAGNSWFKTDNLSIDFHSTFIAPPIVTPLAQGVDAIIEGVAGTVGTPTTTKTTFYGQARYNTWKLKIGYIAIGRWK